MSSPEKPAGQLPTRRNVTGPRPLERPKVKAKVLAMMVDGMTDKEIADALSTTRTPVTRQSVNRFRIRHADEIAPALQELQERTVDLALSMREDRVRERAWLYGLAKREAEEHGVVVVERTEERDDDDESKVRIIETRDFRTGMVKEMRGLLHDIAEELDQLPRAGLTVQDNRVQIVVRRYDGFEPEELE